MRRRRTSTFQTPMETLWRCLTTVSTLCARNGSRSRRPRSCAIAYAGATASRALTITKSVPTSSSSTSMLHVASAGARTLVPWNSTVLRRRWMLSRSDSVDASQMIKQWNWG